MLAILADEEPSGEHPFNLDYYNGLISDDYEIKHADTSVTVDDE
jgi:hypothetical protein